MDKQQARHEAQGRLLAMSASDMEASSRRICQKLQALLLESEPFTVLAAFIPMKREPNLMPLMASWIRQPGRTLLLPQYQETTRDYCMVAVQDLQQDLVPGKYNIPEPKQGLPVYRPLFENSSSWIWLIPALGFNTSGLRLGRGGGYYDRLLNGTTGIKIGVGYDCQIFDTLPSEPHDVSVHVVMTESRTIPNGWHLNAR